MDTSEEFTGWEQTDADTEVWQEPDYTVVEAAPEVTGHSLTER
ncbi:pyrroloquinoline quinone precursor peptide PqqA [Kitasatospora sp. NPDC127067]